MSRFSVFLLSALLGCVAAFAASAQTLSVTPQQPVLEGDPVAIQLSGFTPAATVTLVAQRVNPSYGQPVLFRSEAVFQADAAGRVDVSTAKPVSGSYRQADMRGLFWSMSPAKATPSTGLGAGQVLLQALVDGQEVAHASVQFIPYAPEVKATAIQEFPGAVLASLGGPTPRPVVIVLGGSEGGAAAVRDAALRMASRGFATMSLPYFSPAAWGSTEREVPALPQSFVDIPVDRLEAVRDWLRKRTDVDATRIGVLGISKGAEYALIAASRMPWITTVAAIVPTDVVWQGWGPDVAPGSARSSFSYRGQPLAFTPNQDFPQELMGFQTGEAVRFRRPQDKGRAAHPAAAVAARIHVEDFKGPMLVAGGMDDQVWNSGMMAQNIAERRAEAKLDTVTLVYPDAGHVILGSGWSPTTQYNAGPNKMGGTPEANAAAQAEVRREVLAFFQRHLRLER